MASGATLSVLLTLKDEFSNRVGTVNSSLNSMSANFKKAGAALTAFGAVGIGVFGLAIKSAAEEEAGIMRLSVAMKNAGISYEQNRDSLEALILAQQKQTAFGDGEQRDALTQLIQITGDYEDSLELLPLVMDFAVGKSMDLSSAAVLVGRATSGNAAALSRYVQGLSDSSTRTQVLAAVLKAVGGQAETFGKSTDGMIANVKNSFSDLMDQFGGKLLPLVNKVLSGLLKLMDWFSAIPEPLQTFIVVFGGVVTVFAAVAGPILLFLGFLPQIVAGIGLVGAALAVLSANPIVLIVAAIVGLGVAVYALWKNWDTVWGWIKRAFEVVSGALSKAFRSWWGWLLPGGIFVKAIFFIKEHWDAIWGGISSGFKGFVNIIISGINYLIRALNSLLSFQIPDWVPGFGGKGWDVNIPEIPALAQGGIVTSPMVAMIGDRGPKAIIPLSRGGGQALAPVTINITVQGSVMSDRQLAATLTPAIRREMLKIGNRNTSVGLA